jgi:glycerol-3-phosphate acyltransferase PlsY
MVNIYLLAALLTVGAYLLGSVNSAIIIGRIRGVDVKKTGSGSAGFTNVLRTIGLWPAVFVLIFDCLKPAIALTATIILAPHQKIILYLASIGAILGHNFPVFFGFRGGKGVLVSMVCVMFTTPVIGIFALISALAVMFFTRIISLGSIIGTIIYIIINATFHTREPLQLLFSVVVGGLILFMHRANIRRIRERTEKKISVNLMSASGDASSGDKNVS